MKKSNKRKLKLLKGEIFMYFVLLALIISIPTINVFSKALLSETNIKTEKLKRIVFLYFKIEKITSRNGNME